MEVTCNDCKTVITQRKQRSGNHAYWLLKVAVGLVWRSLLRETQSENTTRGSFALLTAFNFQGAVLFIKRVPPQVHHASSSGGYSDKKKDRNRDLGDIIKTQREKNTEDFMHFLPAYEGKV